MKITSKENKIVKLVRKLHSRKGRKENGLFIIEGEKLIREADAEGCRLKYFFYREEKQPDFKLETGPETFEVAVYIMEAMATTDSPPPFLAVAEIPPAIEPDYQKSSLLLVLCELQDPGNLGTIIRSSEAAGVDYIIATKGTVDLYNPKVVRSTMGTLFRQPVIYIDDLNAFLSSLKDWQTVMTTPYTDRDFYSADYKKKTVIVMGNEGQGIDPALLKRYEKVKIPMLGRVESLNTSVAASLILFEALRQRNFS